MHSVGLGRSLLLGAAAWASVVACGSTSGRSGGEAGAGGGAGSTTTGGLSGGAGIQSGAAGASGTTSAAASGTATGGFAGASGGSAGANGGSANSGSASGGSASGGSATGGGGVSGAVNGGAANGGSAGAGGSPGCDGAQAGEPCTPFDGRCVNGEGESCRCPAFGNPSMWECLGACAPGVATGELCNIDPPCTNAGGARCTCGPGSGMWLCP
jgi:hypothetical protein